MVNASFTSRLSQAVEQIEKRLRHNRRWKVVEIRRGLQEDPDTALERHYAAHPEDRDADVGIFRFFGEEVVEDGHDAPRLAGLDVSHRR
jgi:hypothetical protein